MAASSSDRAQLEQEMDVVRDQLAQTIDQLVYRANPKTIVGRQIAEIKAYFVDPASGQARTDNIVKVVGGAVGVVALFAVIRKVTR